MAKNGQRFTRSITQVKRDAGREGRREERTETGKEGGVRRKCSIFVCRNTGVVDGWVDPLTRRGNNEVL